jgi:hypothetical protein
MSKNLSKVEIEAAAFFSAASQSAAQSDVQAKSILSKGAFKATNGIIFALSPETRRAERELAKACVKSLGPKTGDEKEVTEFAWDHLCHYLKSGAPFDSAQCAKGFARELKKFSTVRFGYVLPNYLVKLERGVADLKIGPVRLTGAKKVVSEINSKRKPGKKKNWKISAGSQFEINWGKRVEIRLAASCWVVDVGAAARNVHEEATWLIDVATSLIRLALDHQKNPFFPNIGDLEQRSTKKPVGDSQSVLLRETGITYGGFSAVHFYAVTRLHAIELRSPVWREKIKDIFEPTDGSVGQRLAQGLGWLSRARCATDRSERFLFFFTALEALLSLDDKTAPVVQTIARHAAVILTNDANGRLEVATHLKQLYAHRSALVHAGQRTVSNSDVVEIQAISESIFRKVLHKVDLKQLAKVFHKELGDASYGLPWSHP